MQRVDTDPHREFEIAAPPAPVGDDRTLVLARGDTFAVVDRHGDMRPAPASRHGLYSGGTRFLSGLWFQIAGCRPHLLSSGIRSGEGGGLFVHESNPDVENHPALQLERDQIHVVRSLSVADGVCELVLALHSYASAPIRMPIRIGFYADYADVFEVRGAHRARRGRLIAPTVGADWVECGYTGLDGVTRTTRLAVVPAPDRTTADAESGRRARARTARRDRGADLLRAARGRRAQPARSVRAAPRARAGARPRRVALHLEPRDERLDPPLGGRPRDADHPDRARPDAVRGCSVVLHAVRPRCADRRARDALDRSVARARGAALPRCAPGRRRRQRARRRARQDHSRDAQRRDGGAARGAVRALLRERRRHAAVRAGGRALFRAHGRPRAARGAVAPPRARARVDRRAGRRGRRRLRRVPAAVRARAHQPGMEGLARFDHARGRQPRRGRDRAVRGAGLRLRREGGPRARGARTRLRRARDAAGERSRPAAQRVRGRILVRRALHLRDRARRRQAPVPRAQLERGPSAAHGPGAPGPRGRDRAHTALGGPLLGLGHPHARGVGAALQPDVVSRWLGVAARQCADRGGAGPLRRHARRSGDPDRPVRRVSRVRKTLACPSCYAASTASPASRPRSTTRRARRRRGRRARCSC